MNLALADRNMQVRFGLKVVTSIIFFHNFLQNSLQKLFQFILFFYEFTKIKSFECPKFIRNYEKNNAWNIRRLVNESFVPATQQASVLY